MRLLGTVEGLTQFSLDANAAELWDWVRLVRVMLVYCWHG